MADKRFKANGRTLLEIKKYKRKQWVSAIIESSKFLAFLVALFFLQAKISVRINLLLQLAEKQRQAVFENIYRFFCEIALILFPILGLVVLFNCLIAMFFNRPKLRKYVLMPDRSNFNLSGFFSKVKDTFLFQSILCLVVIALYYFFVFQAVNSSLIDFSRVCTILIFSFLTLSVVDVFLLIRRENKSLLVTRQQYEQEHKEQEGDPFLKSRQRQEYRLILSSEIIERLQSADFLVVGRK